MPLRVSLRLRGPARLLCRVRVGSRDLVLVASAATPRLRALIVHRAAPSTVDSDPPDLLPAA